MKEALDKWLKKYQTDFNIDTTHSLCSSLGLEGEKEDGCNMLVYQYEKGEIDDGEFTRGLCILTEKEPEEIVGILKGMKATPTEIRKEPWQMTLEQYAIEKGARPAWVKAGYGETYRFHKTAVERAIAEGKPVPPEVLEDYPELKDMKAKERAKQFAFYDRPTNEARLVMLYDGTKPEMSALDVGAEFVGDYVEILSDVAKVHRLWTAKTEKGSIFKDRPKAFTLASKERSEPKKD